MLEIIPIRAFSDNYIWCLQHPSSEKQCIVVDPGDTKPVKQYLEKEHKQLDGILCTHHHWDHTGGIIELRDEYQIPVYGPSKEATKCSTEHLVEGNTVSLKEYDSQFKVIDIPGHTLGHIAFYESKHGLLFCGDTLFLAGCGRLFEGSPQQMLRSLQKLAALPNDTLVYCAHEYTLANLCFAGTVEPDNEMIKKRIHDCQEKDKIQAPTVPESLEIEKQSNPFLRSHEAAVKQAAETYCGHSLQTELEVFTVVRAWKDGF